MKKLLTILLAIPSLLTAAPTIEVTGDGIVIINGVSRGLITDVVKNYSSVASTVRSTAKTVIESKIDAANALNASTEPKTSTLSLIKPAIDLCESAGVVFNASKKSLVTDSVTIESEKKADLGVKKQ